MQDNTQISIRFDSPEALLEALCVRQFGAFPVYDNAHTKTLAGRFDIESIEKAFFNHDHDGAEPAPGQWEKRRNQWRSFKAYLAAYSKQEAEPERTDGCCTPIVPDDSPCLTNTFVEALANHTK